MQTWFRLPYFFVIPFALAAALYLALANLLGWQNLSDYRPVEHTVPGSKLSAADQTAVASIVAHAVKNDGPLPADLILPERLQGPNMGMWVGARARGAAVGRAHFEGEMYPEALIDTVRKVVREATTPPDSLQLCFAHTLRKVDIGSHRGLGNFHRGVRGLRLYHEGGVLVRSPWEMIASNRHYPRLVEQFAKEKRTTTADIESGTFHTFECEQFYVKLDGANTTATFTERANNYVPMSAVDRASVDRLATDMADWLIRQVHGDGRVTYKFWPSNGRESPNNNMIRQWMASVALVQTANRRGIPELLELSLRNIRYNLGKFYRTDSTQSGDLGYILYRGKAKLGAAALAVRAMAELPEAERAEFAGPIAALLKGMAALRKPSGAYTSFYRPPGLNDNQNFYPGEALYTLAELHRRSPTKASETSFMESFRYYQTWHLTNRNPAFVPWHTQAYVTMWHLNKSDELRDFVFEMNDWLLGMQQWKSARYRDLRGRFFDPKRTHFGPPHASATGVYLEGLADAFVLARKVGDEKRVAAYRQAIVRGIRSVMQLSFTDDIDMFYIQNRSRVRGGVRETVYNNEIRVDNVQHSLAAVYKILDAFRDQDFIDGQQ